MTMLLSTFVYDESGVVLSAELVLVATITVLGVIVGLGYVQSSVVSELQDVAAALSSLNQSYGYSGYRGCWKWWGRTSWTAGSSFWDIYDSCALWSSLSGTSEVAGFYGGSFGASSGVTSQPAIMSPPNDTCPDCPNGTDTPTPCFECPTPHPADATPSPSAGPTPQIIPQH